MIYQIHLNRWYTDYRRFLLFTPERKIHTSAKFKGRAYVNNKGGKLRKDICDSPSFLKLEKQVGRICIREKEKYIFKKCSAGPSGVG